MRRVGNVDHAQPRHRPLLCYSPSHSLVDAHHLRDLLDDAHHRVERRGRVCSTRAIAASPRLHPAVLVTVSCETCGVLRPFEPPDATPSRGGFQSSGRVPRRPRDARVRLVPTEALNRRIRLCCADSHCALVSRTAPTRTCSASAAGRARPIAPIRIEAAERPRVARLRRSRSTRRGVESIEQIVSAMRSPRRSRAARISARNAMASTAKHASVDEIGDHGQRGLGADNPIA